MIEHKPLGRVCALCGGDLSGRRRDAVFCSRICRAEASRIRRLLSGLEVDGYKSLAERLNVWGAKTRSGARAWPCPAPHLRQAPWVLASLCVRRFARSPRTVGDAHASGKSRVGSTPCGQLLPVSVTRRFSVAGQAAMLYSWIRLARQPQDELADLLADPGARRAAARIAPAARHEPAMPAKQRLRPHEES